MKLREENIFESKKKLPQHHKGAKNKENNGNRDGYQRRTSNWCQCIGERSGTGTVTDVDGNFTLDAPADALLAVSYIGYKTQEVKGWE